MFEPFKINRVLPPHELNARRARKRILPQPPPMAHHPVATDTFHDPAFSPHNHVLNHGTHRTTSNQTVLTSL